MNSTFQYFISVLSYWWKSNLEKQNTVMSVFVLMYRHCCKIHSEGPTYTRTFFMGDVTSTTIKIAWELRHQWNQGSSQCWNFHKGHSHSPSLFRCRCWQLGRLRSHAAVVWAMWTTRRAVGKHWSAPCQPRRTKASLASDLNKPLP
jgi:hypothetical protein